MENQYKVHHRGRFRQIPIYLGKFFRSFVFLNDWKVLPMAALIAALVAFVASSGMFQTMEGTALSTMAITCICLWNGCFNSIQVVCRERDIVKREHRSGMYIFSYISAHMIYQAFLCLLQSIITIVVFYYSGMDFPIAGLVTPWFLVDFGITLFLITYAADMMSLMISCIVRNTTAAMTVMPLVLIFQLVFSGIMFSLNGAAAAFKKFTIAHWGMRSICTLANYNSLPMVSVWNQIFKFRDYDVLADYPELESALESVPGIDQNLIHKPISALVDYMEQNGLQNEFMMKTAQSQINADYTYSAGNVGYCWLMLLAFVVVFALLAMFFLNRVDKDKR